MKNHAFFSKLQVFIYKMKLNSSTAHNITSLKGLPTHSCLYLMQVKPHCSTIHSEILQLDMLPATRQRHNCDGTRVA